MTEQEEVNGADVPNGVDEAPAEEEEKAPPAEEEEEPAVNGTAEGDHELAADGDEEAPVAEGDEEEEMLPMEEPPIVTEEPPKAEVNVEDDTMGEDVAEHLKEAMEGSMRLKRMLSTDGLPAAKKRKIGSTTDPEILERAKFLEKKWGLADDAMVHHVLLGATTEELDFLKTTNFTPNRFDAKRGPGELTEFHLVKQREAKLGVGSKVDILAAFKFRWSLNDKAEKMLRDVPHKDLRTIVETYDGTRPLEEMIEEASAMRPDEDAPVCAATSLPGGPGLHTMSRFNRMELIDPFSHSAVFGDANLTFSLNLVRHRAGLGHVGRVIATTFEEIHTLRERYAEIDDSIKTLEDHDAEVYHGVDCTRIAVDPRFKGMEGALGAVYYNFPHSGAIPGFFDSHPMVNWRHENLMRLFFRALRSFVKPGGLVKVASNGSATGVRYSFIVGSAVENEFEHVETMPFMEWMLHRYGRSYGDRRDKNRRPDAKNNQSYNAQNANADMVYCFKYKPSGKPMAPQRLRLPPTLETLQNCWDGPFRELAPGAKAHLARQLHDRFLKEISGTHVG